MFKTAATAALILAATTVGSFAQSVTAPIQPGKYLTATTFQAVVDETGTGICAAFGLVAGNTGYGVDTIGAYNTTTSLSPSSQVLVNQVAAVPATSSSAGSPAALNPATCLNSFPQLTTGTAVAIPGSGASCAGAAGSFNLLESTAGGLPATTATAIGAGALGINAFVVEEGVLLQAVALEGSSADPSGVICALAIEEVSTYSGQ